MCDVNKDIFIEQQVRKPMEIPVTKPQDPLEVNEIIKGPLNLKNFGEVPKSLLVKLWYFMVTQLSWMIMLM